MLALFLTGKIFFGLIASEEIVIIPVPLSALFFLSVWCTATADFVLLHLVLVDPRVSVNVPADDVHDLRPDEELRAGFQN